MGIAPCMVLEGDASAYAHGKHAAGTLESLAGVEIIARECATHVSAMVSVVQPPHHGGAVPVCTVVQRRTQSVCRMVVVHMHHLAPP